MELQYVPSKEINPHTAQTIRQRPTDCVSRKTPFGEINIPEPNSNKQS
jgi:hypothetical protein